jgi:hypothetical protein
MMMQQMSRSLLVGLAVVVVLGLGALAQSVSLTVTAYSDAVRFSAQGAVKELRVEVLSLSGQKVFDSGPVLGNALDWKLANTQGQPVANGVYLYTVTVKDPSGNVTKKLGKLAVLRGKGGAAPPLQAKDNAGNPFSIFFAGPSNEAVLTGDRGHHDRERLLCTHCHL